MRQTIQSQFDKLTPEDKSIMALQESTALYLAADRADADIMYDAQFAPELASFESYIRVDDSVVDLIHVRQKGE